MGFGSILDVFKADNWSSEIVARIGKMLAIGHEMYDYASAGLLEGRLEGDPLQRIYERDKKINKIERKIRRRVVERLSLNSTRADIPSALIFMNAVKDGERIGDYVKNLHEVGVERIRRHNLALCQLIIDRAQAAGLTIRSPLDHERRTGFVAVDFEGSEEVSKQLIAEHVKHDWRPNCGLRLGPHFYTTDEEVERAMERIVALAGRA